MKWFKIFPFAKKLPFLAHFLSFFYSVAMLCNLKKPSIGQKMANFRQNAKSLNHFYISKIINRPYNLHLI